MLLVKAVATFWARSITVDTFVVRPSFATRSTVLNTRTSVSNQMCYNDRNTSNPVSNDLVVAQLSST